MLPYLAVDCLMQRQVKAHRHFVYIADLGNFKVVFFPEIRHEIYDRKLLFLLNHLGATEQYLFLLQGKFMSNKSLNNASLLNFNTCN